MMNNSPGNGVSPLALGPMPTDTRTVAIDVLRGFALIGILIMNIESFAGPESLHDIPIGTAIPTFVGWHQGLDYCLLCLKWCFIEGKMRALFSLLFGASIVLFMQRAEARRGINVARTVYFRRNALLAVFGLLHGIFIWSGDILLLYSVCALLFLFPFRNMPARRLITFGAGLCLGLGSIGLFIFTDGANVLLNDNVRRAGQQEIAAGRRPSSAEAIVLAAVRSDAAQRPRQIAEEVRDGLAPYWKGLPHRGVGFLKSVFAIIASGGIFDVGGFMLLGMGLYKTGFLSAECSRSTYLVTAIIGYLVAIPVECFGVWQLATNEFSEAAAERWLFIPYEFTGMGAMLANASILLLIVKHGKLQLMTHWLSAVGRTAFSNYIGTSVICQTVFVWGPWKLYGDLGYLSQMLVVVSISAINIAFSVNWLKRFRMGPLEWVWRTLTYGKIGPMRI